MKKPQNVVVTVTLACSCSNQVKVILCFNPPCSHAFITNVAKKFLQLIDLHFPPSRKFHKIFNRNNVKISYYCTQNVGNIIESRNKKLINSNKHHAQPGNCRKKEDWPLEGKCNTENIIYKLYFQSSSPDKVYIEDFRKRYNQIGSFKNETQMNKTTLAKYVWEQKQRHNLTPTLKWYIVKSVPSYSNITKSMPKRKFWNSDLPKPRWALVQKIRTCF